MLQDFWKDLVCPAGV